MDGLTSINRAVEHTQANLENLPKLPLEILQKIFAHHLPLFFTINKRIRFSILSYAADISKDKKIQTLVEEYIFHRIPFFSSVCSAKTLRNFPFINPLNVLFSVTLAKDSEALPPLISNPSFSSKELQFKIWNAILKIGDQKCLATFPKLSKKKITDFNFLFLQENFKATTRFKSLLEIKEAIENSELSKKRKIRELFTAFSLATSLVNHNEAMVTGLLEKYPKFHQKFIWCYALAFYAKKGNLLECQFFMKQHEQFNYSFKYQAFEQACEEASRYNHLPVLRFLLEFKDYITIDTIAEIFNLACKYKHLDQVLWLYQNYQSENPKLFLSLFRSQCIDYQNIETVELLLPYFSKKLNEPLLRQICLNTSLPILKLFYQDLKFGKQLRTFLKKDAPLWNSFFYPNQLRLSEVFYLKCEEELISVSKANYNKLLIKRKLTNPLGLLYAFQLAYHHQQRQKALIVLKLMIQSGILKNYYFTFNLWSILKEGKDEKLLRKLLKYLIELKTYIPFSFQNWLIEKIYQQAPEFKLKKLYKLKTHPSLANWTVLKLISDSFQTIYTLNEKKNIEKLQLLDFENALKTGNVEKAEKYYLNGKESLFRKKISSWTLSRHLAFFCRYSAASFFKKANLVSSVTGDDFFTYLKVAYRYNNPSVVKLILKATPLSPHRHSKLLTYARFWGYEELEVILENYQKKFTEQKHE